MQQRRDLEESLPGLEADYQRTRADLTRCEEIYSAEQLREGACQAQTDAFERSRDEVTDLCKRIHSQGGTNQSCWENYGL